MVRIDNLNGQRNERFCKQIGNYVHTIQNEHVIAKYFYEICLSFLKMCVILTSGIGLVTSAQHRHAAQAPYLEKCIYVDDREEKHD